ncbi:MAG: hypothetical protein ACE5GZ_13620, partial [Gammaproteobacteria bacterium]
MTSYLGGARRPETAHLDDEQSLEAIMQGLVPVLGITGEPEMICIHRHQQGLPLYHGGYYGRMQAISNCLRTLPGLHLEANYRNGISVRDRLVCAYTTARNILVTLDLQKEPRPASLSWANANP